MKVRIKIGTTTMAKNSNKKKVLIEAIGLDIVMALSISYIYELKRNTNTYFLKK